MIPRRFDAWKEYGRKAGVAREVALKRAAKLAERVGRRTDPGDGSSSGEDTPGTGVVGAQDNSLSAVETNMSQEVLSKAEG
eukprot:10021634-Prorocentrum_lima.AAC.1